MVAAATVVAVVVVVLVVVVVVVVTDHMCGLSCCIQVHLIGTPDYTIVGRPFVSNAKVSYYSSFSLLLSPPPSSLLFPALYLMATSLDIVHHCHLSLLAIIAPSLHLLCSPPPPPPPPPQVHLQVEEQAQDAKIIVFKKKRRKGYKRKKGFRREVTIFRVTDIVEG